MTIFYDDFVSNRFFKKQKPVFGGTVLTGGLKCFVKNLWTLVAWKWRAFVWNDRKIGGCWLKRLCVLQAVKHVVCIELWRWILYSVITCVLLWSFLWYKAVMYLACTMFITCLTVSLLALLSWYQIWLISDRCYDKWSAVSNNCY